MEPEVQAAFNLISLKIDALGEEQKRLLAKMERRDLIMFGEDARSGLVGDMTIAKAESAAAKAQSRVVMWLTGGLLFPIVTTLLVWLLTSG